MTNTHNIPLTIELVNQAFAAFLKVYFPDCKVYDNPNQQGTKLPCWFITLMPSVKLDREIGSHYYRELSYDLVYEEDYNLTDLMDRYVRAAQIIDENLDLLTYKYVDNSGEEPLTCIALLHLKDREWTTDLSAMHYKLKIRVRVLRAFTNDPKMQYIEDLTEKVNDNGQIRRITYRMNNSAELYLSTGVSSANLYSLFEGE